MLSQAYGLTIPQSNNDFQIPVELAISRYTIVGHVTKYNQYGRDRQVCIMQEPSKCHFPTSVTR